MHCGNYPAQREGKAQLCSALLCVCFARLLQPGVKAGLFFLFLFLLQRRVKAVTMEDGMFSTRRAISSPFTILPLLWLEMHEVCFIGGPLGRNSDHKASCGGRRDLLFVRNQTPVISCLCGKKSRLNKCLMNRGLPPLLLKK